MKRELCPSPSSYKHHAALVLIIVNIMNIVITGGTGGPPVKNSISMAKLLRMTIIYLRPGGMRYDNRDWGKDQKSTFGREKPLPSPTCK
jgi:hypothetical protein